MALGPARDEYASEAFSLHVGFVFPCSHLPAPFMSGHIVFSTKGFRGLEIWGIRSTALWWEAEKQPWRPGPKGFSQASCLPLLG